MRSASTLAACALLGIALPVSAARGVASATIVVPASVVAAPASGSPVVSITSVRSGDCEQVTVAFN